MLTVFLGTVGAFTLVEKSKPTTNQLPLRKVIHQYIQELENQGRWETLQPFYSNAVQKEAVLLNPSYPSKSTVSQSFNTETYDSTPENIRNNRFKVKEVIIEQRFAAIKGNYISFCEGNNASSQNTPFVIWLRFDQANRIIDQTNFIKYPDCPLP